MSKKPIKKRKIISNCCLLTLISSHEQNDMHKMCKKKKSKVYQLLTIKRTRPRSSSLHSQSVLESVCCQCDRADNQRFH